MLSKKRGPSSENGFRKSSSLAPMVGDEVPEVEVLESFVLYDMQILCLPASYDPPMSVAVSFAKTVHAASEMTRLPWHLLTYAAILKP
jgi:hypothetical protein